MTTTGFRSTRRKLQRMERKAPRKVERAVDRTLNLAEHRMKTNLIEHDAVATTKLFRSFRQIGQDLPFAGEKGTRFILTNTDEGAIYVEYGTGDKGKYPAPSYGPRLVAAIIEWAIAKPGLQPKSVYAFAEAVSRNIAGQGDAPSGTDSRPFFWPAWEETEPLMRVRVRKAFKQAVNQS